MRLALPILVLVLPTSAAAHGAYGQLAPDQVLPAWQPDVAMTLVILALAQAYAVGIARLRGRGTRRAAISHWQSVGTYGGLLALWLALASPLEAVTGTLLTAHMVQHLILIAVAPPLLLAGRPDLALQWLLPARARRTLARARLPLLLRLIARPVPAALLHAVAMWGWHAPPLFEAAMASEGLHNLEHASFFGSALLFWYAAFAAARSPSLRLQGVVAVVITLIQGGLLGALLTLAGRPLYPGHGEGPLLWGLTALADQQLAGLVMWVPAGAIYLIAGGMVARRLIGRTTEPGSYRAASGSE